MPPFRWLDSHAHLDAPEFDADRDAVIERARAAGVPLQVWPAVRASDADALAALAARHGQAWALGIHPLYVGGVDDTELDRLDEALSRHRGDPRLVAVGEIGLDFFVPGLDHERQLRFYEAQLRLARHHDLPVLLHVRNSADALLAGLRRLPVAGGIAHAFNGSTQQARMFVARGFALGFGGAATFERARQIRALAASLPEAALVVETDAPDIPPHWLYRTAHDRAAQGGGHGRNEPAELARIGAAIAALRGLPAAEFAALTAANAQRVLPRLAPLWAATAVHTTADATAHPVATPGA